MTEFQFNPFAEHVSFKYKCPHCHQNTSTDAFPVPYPNFAADNQSDSENEESYDTFCQNCGESISVDVINGMYGGTVMTDEIDQEDAFDFTEEFAEETENRTYEYYTDAFTILDDIKDLSDEAKAILYRLLYANAIAYMEAFLGDTLKYEATKDDSSMRRFIENCIEFQKRKFALSDIYNRLGLLKNEILSYLQDLLYHNLYVIGGLYRDCLGIELGDLSDLSKAVQIRHDIVHRNGKNKDGVMHNISKADVVDVWEKVEKLVKHVNSKLVEQHIGTSDFL